MFFLINKNNINWYISFKKIIYNYCFFFNKNYLIKLNLFCVYIFTKKSISTVWEKLILYGIGKTVFELNKINVANKVSRNKYISRKKKMFFF